MSLEEMQRLRDTMLAAKARERLQRAATEKRTRDFDGDERSGATLTIESDPDPMRQNASYAVR